MIPTINCQPLTLGCDAISTSAGGATGVKGLNAVDSVASTNQASSRTLSPRTRAFAGNGSALTTSIGEILRLQHRAEAHVRADLPGHDHGVTPRAWSSGGDPSCEYDPSNGGHWFFTEIVSASPRPFGGAFTGCFSAVANECYEGIAVSQGSNPPGPTACTT